MNIEEMKSAIKELPTEEFYTLRKWIHDDESHRRYDLQEEKRRKAHIKKIKSFRNGHRLVITKDIYSARGKIAIPAGTVVKLLNTKKQRTRAEIYYEKTDEEWLINFEYLEDAQDPDILNRVRSDANTVKKLNSLFRN